MAKRPILLCLLGLSLLQLFTAAFAQTCQKKIWRKLGITGHVSSCRYWCKGLMPKIGKEVDGTPCKKLFRAGTCKDGKCLTDVPADPSVQKASGPAPPKKETPPPKDDQEYSRRPEYWPVGNLRKSPVLTAQ